MIENGEGWGESNTKKTRKKTQAELGEDSKQRKLEIKMPLKQSLRNMKEANDDGTKYSRTAAGSYSPVLYCMAVTSYSRIVLWLSTNGAKQEQCNPLQKKNTSDIQAKRKYMATINFNSFVSFARYFKTSCVIFLCFSYCVSTSQ